MAKARDHRATAEYFDKLHEAGQEMDGVVAVKANVKKNADSILSVRLNDDDMDLIEAAAAVRNMKLSAFVREAAVKAALEAQEHTTPAAMLAIARMYSSQATDLLAALEVANGAVKPSKSGHMTSKKS